MKRYKGIKQHVKQKQQKGNAKDFMKGLIHNSPILATTIAALVMYSFGLGSLALLTMIAIITGIKLR